MRARMVDETVLENEFGVFDPVEHHLVEIDDPVRIQIRAGNGQWAGENDFLVEKD